MLGWLTLKQSSSGNFSNWFLVLAFYDTQQVITKQTEGKGREREVEEGKEEDTPLVKSIQSTQIVRRWQSSGGIPMESG